MKRSYHLIAGLIILLFLSQHLVAQITTTPIDSLYNSATFADLKFRNIGPAFMSGRIADVAIQSDNPSTWYVAAGSGGVWKTENAGITWLPVFDKQASYSIGCVTIDPNNPNRIWVGTGENIGGRHVGFGDGVYKSEDGGQNWVNMGLKESQHISKIVVHPSKSNIIWVVVQGPLWSKGGERGIYRSVDGGKSWVRTLGDDAWMGATDLVIDPRNPDRMYAASWQRSRNVAVYMGGGPGTGIYKSVDGGLTWLKLSKGLPTSNMGKIGLAISPQKPDIIYAAIELDRRTGGVFKSTDRGASWVKQSEAISSATGPHYYQELYASPFEFDKIYLMDIRIQVSEDGGKKFRRMTEIDKHSDNHTMAFRLDDPDYMLVGTDGGLYETFDDAKNWRFIPNLPLTQFYKVALDDSEPFYNIYGGTQDNSTQGGPSRTDNRHGIRNADWFMVLDADGHQPATEPGNPNIMYAEWQEGNLNRIDRATGEVTLIKPQPEIGEPHERFNWDAPILVSPHSPTRLYYGSQRVWRSDDRGDSWKPVSKDLTRNQERLELPIMGKVQSWDASWDLDAMSEYNTITSLAESQVKEGLIYAGTDDGIIQVTEDGGENWRKIEIGSIPGVPQTAFVNNIVADLFDANTVYVVLDNHKFGEIKPYLIKSTDKGNTWQDMHGDLPDRLLVWRIVQDHEKANLFFLATEFGIYFTIDAGKQWIKLNGGIPTISFRDIAIQRRENDLVGASFGRGFFVLDDYSPLRNVSIEQLKSAATLFQPKDAWWYIQRPVISFSERASQGASVYQAPNPPFGAVFTYYLSETIKTKKELRTDKEKELQKSDQDITFPGWFELEKEVREENPEIVLMVLDASGNIINRVKGPVTKGMHRVVWDLTYPSLNAIDPDVEKIKVEPKGMMAAPGSYRVVLTLSKDGNIKLLSDTLSFNVIPLMTGSLAGSSPENTAKFWRQLDEMSMRFSATNLSLNNALKKVAALKLAFVRSKSGNEKISSEIYNLKEELLDLQIKMSGDPVKSQIGVKSAPSIIERIGVAREGNSNSTYGPSLTHERSIKIANEELESVQSILSEIIEVKMPAIEKDLKDAGAPWIEGEPLPEK